MRHYCALIDRGYLKYFLVLYESMERWCKPFTMHVMGLDEQVVRALAGLADVEVSPASVIETKAIRLLKPQRPYKYYVWTLKPRWIRHVVREVSAIASFKRDWKYTQGKIHHVVRREVGGITYLDTDSYFFASPDGLYEEIGDADMAITPHRFMPSKRQWAGKVGTFNAGFVYFRGEHACLDRWCKQTLDFCGRKAGHFVDQFYLDEWPKLWGAHIVQHKGVNLAPWNQGEGQYTYSHRDGAIYVDEDPLIWYHFHHHLEPHYKLDPFVREFLYEPYKEALERVKC